MFKKYNSIENTYREEILDKIKSHGFWNNEFVVQENVHGSNLSFLSIDGENFSSAKRTSSLEPDERFYNHQLLLESLLPSLRNIWRMLSIDFDGEIKQLNLFGEVCGGVFPHKEVKRNGQAIQVQKGVFYSPNNLFYAFDILINNEVYVDVDRVNSLFEKEGMTYAKTLFKGNIEQCLEHSNAFNSTIPRDLGLPELDENICEGVIIKPLKTSYFRNGSRVILKNKNEKWSEKEKTRRSIKKEVALPEKIVLLKEVISTYVTENRLNNVISKLLFLSRIN